MSLRIALGQFNAAVGDIDANVEAMRHFYSEAKAAGADLLVFPEMCICGYPPEDLLHKPHFLEDNRLALEKFAASCTDITTIAGFAEFQFGQCFNSLAVLKQGQIRHIYRKGLLPNYGVFDEQRYFKPGTEPLSIELDGIKLTLTICEDIWELDWLESFLAGSDPCDIIINASASPFHLGKVDQRKEVFARCSARFGCGIAYCNLIGGQDELVFDGRSTFIDASGQTISQAKAFQEDLLIADIEVGSDGKTAIKAVKTTSVPPTGGTDPIDEVYNALVLGTRDYVHKNNFSKVLIGLSGGIDSALTAVIAADAISSENILGVTLPTRFNSSETISDAETLAKNLNIEFKTIPIAEILDVSHKTLGIVDGWDDSKTAYENLQARIRGNILMSLSNQFGYLVLTCGNKSETAVGYSTLYGDTAGGFAVIKDVPKTLVYELSRYINKKAASEVIPQTIIDRPPSAELRPGQKDTDSLPDYDLLDTILTGYIEHDRSAAEIIEQFPDAENDIRRIIRLVDVNEYKRRQSPPGIKITPKAFGRDRRMPITNRYAAHENKTSEDLL